MSTVSEHPSFDRLLDYWLHDDDAKSTDAIDAHLMHCESCGRALDGLIALANGVRTAFRGGAVSAVTSDAFLRRLVAAGMRVREYRLAHNGSVNCTVAPDDELLVAHLEAPLRGVAHLDAVAQLSIEPGTSHRLEDIPFDPETGEVIYVPKLADLRRLPAHTLEVTLVAVAAGSTREVGRYTFRHRPWPGT
jgi:hypothetical protein